MNYVTAAHIVLIQIFLGKVSSLSCYKCHSFNNTDPHCGDPFHPYYGNYVKDCTAGKDNRIGEFPAKHCIKLIGKTDDNIEMVFRGCSLESLDSQCGDFKYEGVRYRGCLTSCEDDGCNSANSVSLDLRLHIIAILSWYLIFSDVLIGTLL